MNRILTVLLLLLCSAVIHAQNTRVSIRDSVSDLYVRDAVITNADGKLSTPSDFHGSTMFALEINEMITIKAPGYKDLLLRVRGPLTDTMTFYLQPTVQVLENVTVGTMYTKYQLDSVARRTEFEEDKGPTLPTVDKSRTEGFGVVVNLDKPFKKKYRNQRRNEKVFKAQEKQYYVDARYPPSMVSNYTGLKGDQLLDFMSKHTPSYDWLRNHPDRLDMIDYISKELQKYKAPNP